MNNTAKIISTKEKVVVGGALVGGLLFFGFLTNTCKSPLSHFNDKEISSPITAISGDDALNLRIAELENSIEALKDNSVDEKTIANLEAQLYNQKAQVAGSVESLKKHNEYLQDRIKTLSSMSAPVAAAVVPSGVNASELNEKISDLKAELDLAEANVSDLTNKLSVMSASAASADNSESVKLVKEIKFLNEDNKKLASQLTKVKADLKIAKAKAKAEPASDKSAEMSAKIGDLITTVKAQKNQLAAKDEQIADLNANVNKLKAAKNVFAKSADDLPQSAQGLLKDLNALEGKSELEVSTAYAQYLQKHGATSKMRIKFTSGSSSLTAKDKTDIALLTKAAGRNTYFFIVGYADQSGSAASNEKLSSARSTSVARELGINAKANQSTQAVYLGQTDRFGPAAENRVVEIWEIK